VTKDLNNNLYVAGEMWRTQGDGDRDPFIVKYTAPTTPGYYQRDTSWGNTSFQTEGGSSASLYYDHHVSYDEYGVRYSYDEAFTAIAWGIEGTTPYLYAGGIGGGEHYQFAGTLDKISMAGAYVDFQGSGLDTIEAMTTGPSSTSTSCIFVTGKYTWRDILGHLYIEGAFSTYDLTTGRFAAGPVWRSSCGSDGAFGVSTFADPSTGNHILAIVGSSGSSFGFFWDGGGAEWDRFTV
jgi:hypothetical protein